MGQSPKKKKKRGRPSTADLGRTVSVREEEALIELRKGDTYKQIAVTMGIDFDTAKGHITNAYKRLKVTNKVQAINKFFGKN